MKNSGLSKITAALLVLTLIFSAASPAAAAGREGTYTVDRDVVYIYTQPDTLSASAGEITRGRFVTVIEVSGNFGKAFFPSLGIYGWVELSGLKYRSEQDEKTDIVSIEVTPPDKTVYVHEEENADLTGMKVLAVKENGEKTEVKGWRVYIDSFETVGEKSVTVTYTPPGTEILFSDSFIFTVVPLSITGLEILTLPKKTVYKEHETPDLTGLTAAVHYSDRDTVIKTLADILSDPDFTLTQNAEQPLEPGQTEIGLKYKYDNITAAFTLTATPRKLVSLTKLTDPDNMTVYSKNETPDLTGLTLLAQYDNGETQTVQAWQCETVCDTKSFILGPGNEVKAVFENKSVTLYYTLALNEVRGIYIVTPTVLTFRAGFDIDLSALKVYTEYADGSIEPLKDYTVDKVDPALTGTQNIAVKSGDYSAMFSIYISPYYQKGDIDGNGKVDVTDARNVLRAAIGFVKVGGITLEASDIDKNGKVTVSDARMVLRDAIKLEDFIAQTKVILP